MELTAYEIALISGGFGIVGTLFGVFLTHRLALHLANRQFDNAIRIDKVTAKKRAGASLRSTFARQMANIRFSNAQTAVEIQFILEKTLQEVLVETQKFRFYINSDHFEAYDRACTEYQTISTIRALNYQTLGKDKTPKQLVEEKIHAILDFIDKP